MREALIQQLQAEIDEMPTTFFYKDNEFKGLKGTSSETRNLAKAGMIASDSFNLWIVPQDEAVEPNEFLFISSIKYKITSVEPMLLDSGYNLQVERAK